MNSPPALPSCNGVTDCRSPPLRCPATMEVEPGRAATTANESARHCADDSHVEALAIPHGGGCRGEPHLIQGHQTHDGETQSHHGTGRYFHVDEGMEQLDDVPGDYIHHDGDEGQCDNGAFEPHRPHI